MTAMKDADDEEETINRRSTVEEEEEENTLFGFLEEKLNKFFVDHIPVESVHELPPGCKHTTNYCLALL